MGPPNGPKHPALVFHGALGRTSNAPLGPFRGLSSSQEFSLQETCIHFQHAGVPQNALKLGATAVKTAAVLASPGDWLLLNSVLVSPIPEINTKQK